MPALAVYRSDDDMVDAVRRLLRLIDQPDSTLHCDHQRLC
jgi:hypothetical protein